MNTALVRARASVGSCGELTPLGADEVRDLLQRTDSWPGSFPPVYLEPLYSQPREFPSSKLGWPNPAIASSEAWGDSHLELADPLAQFKEWAAMLDDGDDLNVERLDLPPAEQIKKLAVDPKVHGFILPKASPEELRALVDDPAVFSVNIADVAFDLGNPNIE